MRHWLNGFDLRIPLDPWLFIAAGRCTGRRRGDRDEPCAEGRAHPPDPRAPLRMKERSMRLSPSILLLLFGCAPAASASAGTIAVAPFNAVQLRNGGEVRIRQGDRQRVSSSRGGCRRGLQRRETVGCASTAAAPDAGTASLPGRDRHARLDAVSVEEGGRLVVLAGFPRLARLDATVANGGVVDARAMEADQVTAAVAQGGVIFTRPGDRLDAAVSQGGVISYWGDPMVVKAVHGGGVVRQGRAEDRDRPLSELMPLPQAIAPVALIPPLPNRD
jgi:hypothetical protein